MNARIAIYYSLCAFIVLLTWPYTLGSKAKGRILWWPGAAVGLALPWCVTFRAAVYFGLVLGMTFFFWSADTFTNREDRRQRGVYGGIGISIVPFVWPPVLQTWTATCLTATFGHMLASVVLFVLVEKIFARLYKGN